MYCRTQQRQCLLLSNDTNSCYATCYWHLFEPGAACDVNDFTLWVRLVLSPATWAGCPNRRLGFDTNNCASCLKYIIGAVLWGTRGQRSLPFINVTLPSFTPDFGLVISAMVSLTWPMPWLTRTRMAFLNNSNGITAIIFQEFVWERRP